MIYAEGNNREAIKIKKISFPVAFVVGQINYNRYYLPEIPEINKGRIVGIQSQIASQVPSKYFNTSLANFEQTSLGTNWEFTLGRSTTLNLVDDNDRLIIENFPLMQLSGYTNGLVNSEQKILPFDIKINTKKSYIYFFLNAAAPSSINYFINLTFFYRDPE